MAGAPASCGWRALKGGGGGKTPDLGKKFQHCGGTWLPVWEPASTAPPHPVMGSGPCDQGGHSPSVGESWAQLRPQTDPGSKQPPDTGKRLKLSLNAHSRKQGQKSYAARLSGKRSDPENKHPTSRGAQGGTGHQKKCSSDKVTRLGTGRCWPRASCPGAGLRAKLGLPKLVALGSTSRAQSGNAPSERILLKADAHALNINFSLN